MTTERNAEGWYPNVFSQRIGLDPDPRRIVTNSPKVGGSGKTSTVHEEAAYPAPSLEKFREMEQERDALRDEIHRLQKVNMSLSADVVRLAIECNDD